MLKRPLCVLAVTAALFAVAGCGSDDDSGKATGPVCTYTSGGPASKKVDLPPDHATVSGQEKVTIQTSAGDIPATLDADSAPCTVNSFVSLADQGFFDSTPCHRLTTQGIYVLQCGDPTGTSSGGPGYSFPDELTGKETYPAATLAMANSGADTNGSQFFIVYDDSPLDPDYTVFGHVDDAGLKVVKSIAAKGTATGGADGPPKEPVQIESVTTG